MASARNDGTQAEGAPARTAADALAQFEQGWLGRYQSSLQGTIVLKSTGERLPIAAGVRLTGTLPDGTSVRFEARTTSDGSFRIDGIHFPLHYDAHCSSREFGVDARTRVYVDEHCNAISLPVEPGPNKRVAVKVIDDRGTESLKVVDIR